MQLRKRSGLNFSRRRKRINKTVAKEVFTWAWEIAIAVLVTLVFMYFFGFHTNVVGQSMLETLKDGDGILVNRFVYKIKQPSANDVIVFLPNGNENSHYYVKRVVGVPGDTVQIKNGAVYVNGKMFEETTDVSAIENAELAAQEIVVGEDEYFVLGDNRNNSEDSRYANIGNVKKEYIKGKAWFVTSPWKDIGLIK